MANQQERQNEVERDVAYRFVAEQYVSNGYFPHFHRNLEIYGIIKGAVTITIAGQRKVLTDGQMAIIHSLEQHSYEINGEAEIFFLHIGTRYVDIAETFYPNKQLPRWLLDTQYNQQIYQQIADIINVKEELPELRKLGITCQLFSDIVQHYGVQKSKSSTRDDGDIVAEIIQYIYNHYQENITLQSLGQVFFLSPKTLSKKLQKHLNVDLRVFINNVRVQKVMQLRSDPQYKGKTLQQLASMCGFSNMSTFYRSYERNLRYEQRHEG